MSSEIVKAPLTIGQCLQSQRWEVEVKKVLPQYLTPELMLRVARSVATDPKFGQCTPESFLVALIKCGRAGLVPDGRNAHLIPFGREVQAIFDWKGMVAMAGRNGVQVTPKLVHKNDIFKVQEDDGSGCTKVLHEVDFSKSRGEIVAVYSRAKTVKSDEVDYEFMTAEEVEYVRQTFSRAKDSLMWTKSWGEGAKKTVIRRHSKRWDLSPEDRAALMDDDDAPDFTIPAAPAMSKPIFNAPKISQGRSGDIDVSGEQLPPVEEQPPIEEGEGTDPGPQSGNPPASQSEGGSSSGRQNYLKAVRGLCAMGHVQEHELLNFMSQTGVTDGSQSMLEEVAMSQPAALQLVHDHWADISGKILAARKSKGGAK